MEGVETSNEIDQKQVSVEIDIDDTDKPGGIENPSFVNSESHRKSIASVQFEGVDEDIEEETDLNASKFERKFSQHSVTFEDIKEEDEEILDKEKAKEEVEQSDLSSLRKSNKYSFKVLYNFFMYFLIDYRYITGAYVLTKYIILTLF